LNVLAKAALLVAADLLEERELIPLRAAFVRLDGWCPDGLITSRKLRKHLPRMGYAEIPPDLEMLLIEADVDGVGVLDYTTFVAVCLDPDYVLSTKLGHDAFVLMDRDQDGLLSAADVFPLLRAAKVLGFSAELHPKGALDFHGFADLLLTGTCVGENNAVLPSLSSGTTPFHTLSDLARERQRRVLEATQERAHPERLRAIKAKTLAATKQTLEGTQDVFIKKEKTKRDTKRAKPIEDRQISRTPTLVGCLDSNDVANLEDLMGCSQHGSGSEIDEVSDGDDVVSLDGSDAMDETDRRKSELRFVSL
jgi:Ca2+-binding EF-hand superfamily protein